jgi:crotonobetainyl-CoA:carnitine CoA-transferase CaiB-like acyl-CoA transferase
MAHEVPIGPINTIADIFSDPHFAARGDLETLDVPEVGEITVPAVLPRLSETPGRIARLGPALGDANVEIFQGVLGLSVEDMASLRDEGII